MEAVCKHIDDSMQLAGAGIDSPLFWVANGDRRVDQAVRAKMQALGARSVWGTVQSVNSLRGACLAQGILAAQLLRSRFPNIRITESHPKALLWLMGFANRQRGTREGMRKTRSFQSHRLNTGCLSVTLAVKLILRTRSKKLGRCRQKALDLTHDAVHFILIREHLVLMREQRELLPFFRTA